MQRKQRSPLSWSRRRFTDAVVRGSACFAASGFAGSSIAHAGDKKRPSILIVGDSMIKSGFGIFLEQALRKEHGFPVRRAGKSSSGLARPDFYNWMKVAGDLVKEEQADINIAMFGGNDVQGLYMGNKEWIKWPEEGWPDEYARRVTEFANILSPDPSRLFWIGLPVMRPEKFRKRCQKVNTIFRAEMAIRPKSTFIDTWSVMTDEEGNYTDHMVVDPPASGDTSEKKPKAKRVRTNDGIHLTPSGAHHLKAYVLERLLPQLEKA